MRALGALLVWTAACRPAPAPLASCADPLDGVWRVDEPRTAAITPSGEPRRYHVLEAAAGAIELYPMFDDSVLAPGDRKDTSADAVIVAPAAFDLTRTADRGALVGSQTRRFARGAASCVLRTAARLTACAGDRAQLEQTPVAAPADWTRCLPSPVAPAVWTLVRERD